MAKKLKGDQVFTGQLLVEGDVVFMTEDGQWLPDIQLASVASKALEVEALETQALVGVNENIVIDIYPIEVIRDGNGKLEPAHIREKLRCSGPSIAYGYES